MLDSPSINGPIYELDDDKPTLSSSTDKSFIFSINASIQNKKKYFAAFGGFIFNLLIGGISTLNDAIIFCFCTYNDNVT